MTSRPVKVAVRSRPLHDLDLSCLEVNNSAHTVSVANEKLYTFDYCYDQSTETDLIHSEAVQPLIEHFLSGSNVSVIAYGQTGTGKTYTMGTDYNQKVSHHLGIIPKALQCIFEHRSEVYVTFVEIYNEVIYDMLATGRSVVSLQDAPPGGVRLINLNEVRADHLESALQCLEQGGVARMVGSTAVNQNSSRSHAIFSVALKDDNGQLKAKFQFVDLAGSEGSKKAQTEGNRRLEGININKGLLSLGKVINSLCSKHPGHIPYRDSLLTRMLKDSLNGASKTLMIACVNPNGSNLIETVDTLRYASRAAQIKSKNIFKSSFGCQTNPFRSQLDLIPPTPTRERGLLSSTLISTPRYTELQLSPVLDENLMPPPTMAPPTGGEKRTNEEMSKFFSPLVKRFGRMVDEKLHSFAQNQSVMAEKRDFEKFCSPLAKSLSKRLFPRQPLTENDSRSPSFFCSPTPLAKICDYNSSGEKFNLTPPILDFNEAPPTFLAPPLILDDQQRRRTVLPMRFREFRTPPPPPTHRKSILPPNKTRENARILLSEKILAILNDESVKEMQKIPSIGPKTAQIISNHKQVNGPLRSLSQLKDIMPNKGFYKTFLKANCLKQT